MLLNSQNKINYLPPFIKFCYTIGMIPSSYKASLTYEEQLMWLCNFLENTVIPTVNNNGLAVQELQNLFTQLKNYVDNYFSSLNVQTEINNKLDEMAQDGTLDNIINKYITSNILRIFTTTTYLINNPTLLLPGIKVKTYGYYEINDGGGSEFIITENEDTSRFQLKINDYYATFIGDSINICQIGASISNPNNTNFIQSALNLYNHVLIPEGTFSTSTITLNNNQVLEGMNWNSILSLAQNTTNLIDITGNNLNCEIKNLFLHGQNLTSNAININHNGLTNVRDTSEQIRNVKIGFFKGNGININSSNTRSVKIDNCNIENCNNGIYCIGTDNFIYDSLIYWNTLNGIYIKDGASNKIDNTKCFGNKNHGIYINSSSNQLSNIECQDNYFSGLNFNQCWGNICSNIIASTNGVDSTTGSNYPNINFTNCYDTLIDAIIINRSTSQSKIMHSKYGLKLTNSTNINANIKTHTLNQELTPFYYDNINVSNKIVINNVDYSLNNIYKNKLIGIQGDTENLSNIFSSFNTRPNSDGSIRLSKPDQTQYIHIGNNTGTDLTSAVSIYGMVDITNLTDKNNVSFYFNASNSAAQGQAQCSYILTFINQAGGIISQTGEQYGYNGGFLNSAIPQNTAKVQFTITYRPQIVNLNKSLGINNVQVAIY